MSSESQATTVGSEEDLGEPSREDDQIHPGRMFSYCVRARAYTHVLARVYSTRASTCTIYMCSHAISH